MSCRPSFEGPSIQQPTAAIEVGTPKAGYGTHSLRRTRASIIYNSTGNSRAVQILLDYTKIENTVHYLGVDIEDALGSQRELRSDRGAVETADLAVACHV